MGQEVSVQREPRHHGPQRVPGLRHPGEIIQESPGPRGPWRHLHPHQLHAAQETELCRVWKQK